MEAVGRAEVQHHVVPVFDADPVYRRQADGVFALGEEFLQAVAGVAEIAAGKVVATNIVAFAGVSAGHPYAVRTVAEGRQYELRGYPG